MQSAASSEPTVDAHGPFQPIDSTSLVFLAANFAHSVMLREGSSIVVGRTAPADVLLVDPTVSRMHARFSVREGALLVEDMGSHNGVLVNGQRFQRSLVAALDRVQIGAFDVVTFQHQRGAQRNARELSALRFVEELDGELARARYTGRAVQVCALRWSTPAEWRALDHTMELLRTIDRYCLHTPQIALFLLREYDEQAAQAACAALRGRAGPGTHVARVVGQPRRGNGEALIAAAIDAVQSAPDGAISRLDSDVPSPEGDLNLVIGAATREVFHLAERTGRADLPILVLGETGVGKELVARAFHAHSQRRRGPFCAINCAALAPSLLESTLFGHERGAFTGADKRASGLFEQAHGGTLFLDEVGELTASAQSSLLRVLELKRIRRLGSAQEIDVDVRIIAATNHDLHALSTKGLFRADLLYRIDALTVRVPPLRERGDEIAPLSALFLANAAHKWGAPARCIAPAALAALRAFSWPGNVRQLRNAVERAVAVCSGEQVELGDLPEHLADASAAPWAESGPHAIALPDAVRGFESARIRAALSEAGGNRSQAARILGVPRRTLGGKLREYGLE